MTNHDKSTQRTGLWIFPMTAGLLRDAEGIPVLSCLQKPCFTTSDSEVATGQVMNDDERLDTINMISQRSDITARSRLYNMKHDETLWNLWMSFCYVLFNLDPLCIVPKHSKISPASIDSEVTALSGSCDQVFEYASHASRGVVDQAISRDPLQWLKKNLQHPPSIVPSSNPPKPPYYFKW